MKIVSGWSSDSEVVLVTRDGDSRESHTLRAPWAFYLQGADDRDRGALGRISGVSGIKVEGAHTRVECRNRWARRDLVDALQEKRKINVFEGDVSPLKRVLADRGDIQIESNPRLGWFDLETDSRRTFTEMRNGQARVLSYSLHGKHGNAKAVLAHDSDAAEIELLKSFWRAASNYDVLLAWFGSGFDFPVIQERTARLGLQVEWRGWCWLDAMSVFQKYNQAHESGEERTSFKLEDVARNILGRGKVDFDASKTWDVWASGPEGKEKLLVYNDMDTELLPAIEEKTGYVALHLAVCQICRVLPDTDSLRATDQGDGFMLRLGAEHDHRWATKSFGVDDTRKFKGAYVMEPTRRGIIDGVNVADFAGLYPSIMRTFNMSPETWVNTVASQAELNERAIKLPSQNIYFWKTHRGMFPLALDTLVAKRAEYTKRADDAEVGSIDWNMFKRLSQGVKIVANSFYGIVGSPYSRFYNPTIAEGVTQTGAYLIKLSMEEARKIGLDPFYGDTDSMCVLGDSKSFGELVSRLNDGWSALVRKLGAENCYIKLEYEKRFRRMILVSAKRYAATFEVYKGKAASGSAKPEVKGLEYKRGDTIRLARNMQYDAVKTILGAYPNRPTPDEMATFVKEWRKRSMEAPIELGDVEISQSIDRELDEYASKGLLRCVGKSCKYKFKDSEKTCPVCNTAREYASQPAHVRVGKMMQEEGETVTKGSRIRYVITKDGPIPSTRRGALAKIDRGYYWESRIYPATQRVLEVCYPTHDWTRLERPTITTNVGLPLFDRPKPIRTRTRKVVRSVIQPCEIFVRPEHQSSLVYQRIRKICESMPGKNPVILHLLDLESETGEKMTAKLDTKLFADGAHVLDAMKRLKIHG